MSLIAATVSEAVKLSRLTESSQWQSEPPLRFPRSDLLDGLGRKTAQNFGAWTFLRGLTLTLVWL